MNRPEANRSPQIVLRLSIVVLAAVFMIAAGGASVGAATYDPTRPSSSVRSKPGSDDGPPNRQVALGMAVPNSRDLGNFDAFSASIGGKKPAIWNVWSQWGMAATKAFPTSVMNGIRNRGAVPLVMWEPWDRDDRDDPQFKFTRIMAGHHDSYIRAWARDARAYGGPVLLRFAHELNGSHFPWTYGGSMGNTASDIKGAWRHIHGIFEAEGADNVKFLWSVAKKSCSGGCNPYDEFYPGDRYVDYLGFSSYNWGEIAGKDWSTMYDGYRRVVNLLSQISNKPIIAAETASNHIGGDKAAWVSEGYREVYKKLPRVVAIVYLNVDLRHGGHPDWRLTTPNAALSAYAEIAALPEFGGKLTIDGVRATGIATVKQAKKVERKKNVDRTAKSATEPKRKPRVEKGAAVSEKPATKSSKAAGQKAKTTRKKSKKRHEPPATLDMSRGDSEPQEP